MVAKISTGGNMFGALAYNQNKVDSEEAKVLFSNKMLLSEDGNFSIGECMRSFEMQMPVQLSTKKPILHISINPHPEDVLTDQLLSDIAKEYMRKLGYGDQPYLVYKHTDIDRHHIHIVGLRVDENGKPLNDKFEHRRSKQITRELEKKYGLHPAERKERAERPELKKVDYAAGDVKHQIGNTVKAACYGYRFQSFGEYKALLAAYNVCAEEVKGEINGKPYQGIVYSAMNDKGEKTGNPVKASRIGKSVGYEAVQRRMEKSGEAIKNGKLKERTRKIVANAMQTAHSRKELEQQLRKRGIDVVFRQNDSGRIYGVTFIDHDSRVVLNGSRLGKEYSNFFCFFVPGGSLYEIHSLFADCSQLIRVVEVIFHSVCDLDRIIVNQNGVFLIYHPAAVCTLGADSDRVAGHNLERYEGKVGIRNNKAHITDRIGICQHLRCYDT